MWFFFFAAQIRVQLFVKDSACLPCPKKYTPNLHHPKNPKVHAKFKTISQFFYADQPKLLANDLCSKNLQRHNPDSTDSMTLIFPGKNPHQVLSAMAQP